MLPSFHTHYSPANKLAIKSPTKKVNTALMIDAIWLRNSVEVRKPPKSSISHTFLKSLRIHRSGSPLNPGPRHYIHPQLMGKQRPPTGPQLSGWLPLVKKANLYWNLYADPRRSAGRPAETGDPSGALQPGSVALGSAARRSGQCPGPRPDAP